MTYTMTSLSIHFDKGEIIRTIHGVTQGKVTVPTTFSMPIKSTIVISNGKRSWELSTKDNVHINICYYNNCAHNTSFNISA